MACVSLETDSSNCGACANACAAGRRCTAGACVATCNAGQQVCGGACIDTRNDSLNCGACANACGSGQRCTAGACVATCSAPTSLCGTTCYDTQSDPAHCGSCTNACTAAQFCTNGSCTSTCPSPLSICGTSCVATQTSVSHCGACGTVCSDAANMTGTSCRAGGCAQGACLPGFLDCNGTLSDGCEFKGAACTFTWISVTPDGGPADGGSFNPSVDNSGTKVVFTSSAGDLVPNDTNGQRDVFLRDLRTGLTTRVGLASDGGQLPTGSVDGVISGDGRTIAYVTTSQALPTDTNGAIADVITLDLVTGVRSYGLLSASGTQSTRGEVFASPFITTDGRTVMHSGRNSGLYPGDTAAGESNIFLYDRVSQTVKVPSLNSTGNFVTGGTNGFNAASGFISGNGRWVVYNTFGFPLGFPGNTCSNMYITDNQGATPTITRVFADNGVNGTTCFDPYVFIGGMVNNAGDAVFFSTRAALPVTALRSTYDIYYRTSLAGAATSTLVTTSPAGAASNGNSFVHWINETGTLLSFISNATNLAAGDPNGAGYDCFSWNRATNTSSALNWPVVNTVARPGTPVPNACALARLSRGGEWAVMEVVDGLVPGDTNGQPDIYLRRTP